MIRNLSSRALLWLVFLLGIEQMARGLGIGPGDPDGERKSGSNASDSDGETFHVRAWAFNGVTVFDEDELKELLANYSGIKISFAQIKSVASQIEKYYEKNGFLARATVPPQDISSGVVRIEVQEAYLGEIRIEKGSSSLVREGRILSIVTASLQKGDLYDADSLNRGLLLADDLSGVSLTGFLQEGSAPGLVDLNLKTLKEARGTAELSIDNANARALGSERIVFSGRLVSPLKMAEVFSFKSLLSEGSFYRSLSASVPLASTGFKLRLYFSKLSYDVVADEFKALNISGEVEEEGLELTYPLR